MHSTLPYLGQAKGARNVKKYQARRTPPSHCIASTASSHVHHLLCGDGKRSQAFTLGIRGRSPHQTQSAHVLSLTPSIKKHVTTQWMILRSTVSLSGGSDSQEALLASPCDRCALKCSFRSPLLTCSSSALPEPSLPWAWLHQSETWETYPSLLSSQCNLVQTGGCERQADARKAAG